MDRREEQGVEKEEAAVVNGELQNHHPCSGKIYPKSPPKLQTQNHYHNQTQIEKEKEEEWEWEEDEDAEDVRRRKKKKKKQEKGGN